MSSQNEALQPAAPLEATGPAREAYASAAAPARENTAPAASAESTERVRSVLRSLWAARGVFGGLVAILMAWMGENALIDHNDSATSTRYYLIAIIVLVASLAHLTPFWRKATPAEEPAIGDRSDLDGSTVAPATVLPATSEVATEPPAASTTLVPTRSVRSRTEVDSSTTQPVESTPAPTREFVPWTPDPSVQPAGPRAARPLARQTVAAPAVEHATIGATSAADKPRANVLTRLLAMRERLGWRATVPGLALSFVLLIASLLVLRGNVTSVLGGWLWAASLAALVVSVVGLPGMRRGVAPLGKEGNDFFRPGVPAVDGRLAMALLLVVLAVAAFMRLYNLESHPGIFGDEGERGMEARSILAGDHRLLFGWGWWGVPNLYFYLLSDFLAVLGDHNMVADRMFSVVSGIVAVIYVYRIGKLLWGVRVGLIAAALMAVSPLALQFSRLAGESTPTGTLWAVGFFYLVLAMRNRKWSDWVLAGLAWGFSLYFYAAGKMIVPLVAALGFYALVRWRMAFIKQYLAGFVLVGVTMVACIMPYLLYASQNNWYGIVGRAQETSIFSPQNQAPTFQRYNLPYDPALANGSLVQSVVSHPAPWASVFYQQLRETSDVLYRRPDQVFFYRITDHGGTMFPPLWAAIVVLSIAYAAWKLWDGRFGLVGVWFLFGLFGSVLTIDTPNLQRVTGAWPALMLLPAAMLDRVFASSWPASLSFAKKWSAVPIAAAVIFFGFTSYKEYFGHFYDLCPYCDATTQARYVEALGSDYKGYQMGVGGYDVYFGYGSTRFVAKGVEGGDMLDAADVLPITDNDGRGAAFIIYSNNNIYLPIIRDMYPGGTEEIIKSYDGQPHFTSYKLSREQLAKFQTLVATYKPVTGQQVTRDEPNLGTERLESAGQGAWSAPTGLSFPAQATWEGTLVAPAFGTYAFAFSGQAGDARLEIDGRAVLGSGANVPNGKLVLAKGVHSVRLTGTLRDANSRIGVTWEGGAPQGGPVDSRYLYNKHLGGLSGAVGTPGDPAAALQAADPFAGQAPTMRSDPFIGFRVAQVAFGDTPFVARWQGKINIPAEGDYAFTLNVEGLAPANSAQVLINGQPVVGAGSAGGQVHLTAGPHPVDIRYARQGDTRIEWLWTPPGGQTGLVPPSVLTPLATSWLPSELPNAPQATPPQQPAPNQPPANASSNIVQPDAVLGKDAGLSKPRGVAVDKAGNMYVGDRGNHRVVVFSPDGKVLRSFGKAAPGDANQQAGPGEFGDIDDVAVAQDGTVYVLDGIKRAQDVVNRLQAFSSNGDFLGVYDSSWLGLYGPNGIATGPSGGGQGQGQGDSVYIAVTGQNRILKLPSIQTVLPKLGNLKAGDNPLKGLTEDVVGTPDNKFEQPVDVVADPTDPNTLYVIDLKDRIAQVKQSGSGGWVIAKSWKLRVGRDDGGSRLGISPEGKTVYMADPDSSRVAVLDVNGGNVTYFGGEGSDAGQFRVPLGLAVASDGRVYVLDRDNGNVQVFTVKR